MKNETVTRTFVGDRELFPDENGKITLPEELQIEMMKFFLKTSIPRKKKLLQEQALKAEQKSLSSETNSD